MDAKDVALWRNIRSSDELVLCSDLLVPEPSIGRAAARGPVLGLAAAVRSACRQRSPVRGETDG